MNHKLSLIVPYRDRATHLSQFLPHITFVLKSQNIDYHIFIVEQQTGKPFNRAKLLNVGIEYSKDNFDYFCAHDVDMLPIISDYAYCPNPTHLAAQAEQFEWKLPYEQYFGGVTIFDKESLLKINGFSNEYLSYGGEDDDLFKRCVTLNIPISRKQCRFRSLAHERKIDQELYKQIIERLESFDSYVKDGQITEGLSTLEYTILETSTIFENTTKIIVSI